MSRVSLTSSPCPADPTVAQLDPQLSSIPLAAQWASLYDSKEHPRLNLAQGVPGDPPPQEFLDKLADAARDPNTTGYGPLRGELELRRALAQDISRSYHRSTEDKAPVALTDVSITAGCNIVSSLSPLNGGSR